MTLHEAILTVIRSSKEPMKARDISNEINKYEIYKQKKGTPVTQNQIWARVNNYKELFQINELKQISERSEKSNQEEYFFTWVRNLLIHNYSLNYEVLIPFFIYVIRQSNHSSNFKFFKGNVFFEILNSKNKKEVIINYLSGIELNNVPHAFQENIISIINESDNNSLTEFFIKIDAFYDFITRLEEIEFRVFFQKVVTQFLSSNSKFFEFATPSIIAKFIGSFVEIKPNQSIEDPFAGFSVLLTNSVSDKNDIKVIANDISEKVGCVGIINLLVNQIKDFTYTFHDAFINQENQKKVDWVISNPPFFKANYSFKKSEQFFSVFDDWISLIYSKLNKTGKALIITPNTFLFSQEKKYKFFREDLIKKGEIRLIISLPDRVFQPYSGIATSLIYIDKEKVNDGIFFYDLSGLSLNEFEYKIEEISNLIKRKKEIEGKSRHVLNIDLLQDKSLNLLPRKNTFRGLLSAFQNKEIVLLKELIDKRVSGLNAPSFNINEDKDGIPYIRISDLASESQIPFIVSPPSRYISDFEEIHITRFIKEDYILIAKVGNDLKPTIYKLADPALASNGIIGFSLKRNLVSPEYLIEQLKSDYVKEQLYSIQINGVGPNYYRESDLFNLKIVLPELDHQEKPEIKANDDSQKGVFWNKFKNNLLELFKDEENEIIVSEKKINEEEIISSIKHRIAQFVSPVSSDLKNLELYIKSKKEAKDVFDDNDKISGRENALPVLSVFKRMETNLNGISETFDLMKNILYFNKENSSFHPLDIIAIIKEAYNSLSHNTIDVIFYISKEETLLPEDLIIPIDKRQIIEIFRNFFINSLVHGFDTSIPKKVIYIYISKNVTNNFLEISLINNGKPFPDGFTMEDYTTFGRKGTDSVGTGIGGYLMKKVVENHEGKLEWNGNNNIRFNFENGANEMVSIIASIYFKISFPYIHY